MYRWNNYQSHLAHYWQGRYNALYQEMAGGGKVKKSKKAARTETKGAMKWNTRFQELVDFKEEQGHTNVPKKFVYKYTSPPLGQWVSRIRNSHKKGILDPERKKQLEEIGFEFELADDDMVKFSIVWNKCFEALKAFKEVNGHIEVPKGYKPHPEASNLDGWIGRQRTHYRNGKLPPYLKKKLQEVGLNLGGRGRPFGIETEDEWSQNYKALAEYCQKHGDCDVPEKYKQDKQLGIFIKNQRDAVRKFVFILMCADMSSTSL